MTLHILKLKFSLLLTFIIIFKKILFTYCLHVSVLSFVFCVETSWLIHFQGAAMLQHRSVLFAPLNFRTRLFYLVLIFAVLVCASLCFLIFARFVSTPNFRHNAQLLLFCRVLALTIHFILGFEANGRFIFVSLVTRHRYFYFVPWVNFQIFYCLAVPCRSLIYYNFFNKPLSTGLPTSICGNSTDGDGPSLESLGQPRKDLSYAIVTEGVCNKGQNCKLATFRVNSSQF